MESIQKRWFIQEHKGKIEDYYNINTTKALG